MPHLTLEYSSNIVNRVDHAALFSALHQGLSRIGTFKIEDFKSRAYPAAAFFIGTGNDNQSFVNLDIATFRGKPLDERKLLTETALEILAGYFDDTLKGTNCDISVQITELERDVFSRVRSSELLGAAA